MSNAPRVNEVGGIYHVNANVVDGRALFRDDVDRAVFVQLVRKEAKRSSWTILAYTLMRTHYHLLLRLGEPTLSSGFQHVQSIYARRYNRRHGRRGAVWQKRFHDELIESERHLFETIRYIAWNAPRVMDDYPRPEDWPWCGYGSAIGLYPADELVDEEELLGLFDRKLVAARRRLREFVDEGDPRLRRRLAASTSP